MDFTENSKQILFKESLHDILTHPNIKFKADRNGNLLYSGDGNTNTGTIEQLVTDLKKAIDSL